MPALLASGVPPVLGAARSPLLDRAPFLPGSPSLTRRLTVWPATRVESQPFVFDGPAPAGLPIRAFWIFPEKST
jgi:hypothetical protein